MCGKDTIHTVCGHKVRSEAKCESYRNREQRRRVEFSWRKLLSEFICIGFDPVPLACFIPRENHNEESLCFRCDPTGARNQMAVDDQIAQHVHIRQLQEQAHRNMMIEEGKKREQRRANVYGSAFPTRIATASNVVLAQPKAWHPARPALLRGDYDGLNFTKDTPSDEENLAEQERAKHASRRPLHSQSRHGGEETKRSRTSQSLWAETNLRPPQPPRPTFNENIWSNSVQRRSSPLVQVSPLSTGSRNSPGSILSPVSPNAVRSNSHREAAQSAPPLSRRHQPKSSTRRQQQQQQQAAPTPRPVARQPQFGPAPAPPSRAWVNLVKQMPRAAPLQPQVLRGVTSITNRIEEAMQEWTPAANIPHPSPCHQRRSSRTLDGRKGENEARDNRRQNASTLPASSADSYNFTAHQHTPAGRKF